MLEPVRACAFGRGVRASTLGDVRPGGRLPERVDWEWSPHVELSCLFLITLEKHKMLPVFFPCMTNIDKPRKECSAQCADEGSSAQCADARRVLPSVPKRESSAQWPECQCSTSAAPAQKCQNRAD